MNIVILNTVLLNGGDAAIAEALCEQLHEAFGPDAHIHIFDRCPEAASRYYPEMLIYPDPFILATKPQTLPWSLLGYEANIKRLRLAASTWNTPWRAVTQHLLTDQERALLELWSQADLVVSTGGTYLVENYALRPRVTLFDINAWLGRPLVFFTQSLGPFQKEYNLANLPRHFQGARAVLLRDERSKNNLRDLGLTGEHLHVLADCVFGMGDPTTLDDARDRRLPAPGSRDVLISVRHWPHFKRRDSEDGMRRYLEGVGAIATALARRGDRVTFLSTCQGIPEYWTDDSEVAVALHETLPHDVQAQVVVDRSFYPPDKLIERMTQADLIVATRMHMAILGLVATTPVFPIEYEFKTRALFAAMGFESWVQDIEEVDAEPTLQAFLDFEAEVDERRDQLLDAIRDQIASAKRAAPLLTHAINDA